MRSTIFGLGQVSNRNVSNKNELFIVWDSEAKNGWQRQNYVSRQVVSQFVWISSSVSVSQYAVAILRKLPLIQFFFFYCACIHFCISFCLFILMYTTDCCSIRNIFKPIQVELIENWKWNVKQLTFSLSLSLSLQKGTQFHKEILYIHFRIELNIVIVQTIWSVNSYSISSIYSKFMCSVCVCAEMWNILYQSNIAKSIWNAHVLQEDIHSIFVLIQAKGILNKTMGIRACDWLFISLLLKCKSIVPYRKTMIFSLHFSGNFGN